MRNSRESMLWLVSTTSGLALVILLPIHLFLTHTGSLDVLSYDAITTRLAMGSVKLFYGATILALLIHGWAGVRGILLDLEPSRSQISSINLTITTVALLTFGYSVYLLLTIP